MGTSATWHKYSWLLQLPLFFASSCVTVKLFCPSFGHRTEHIAHQFYGWYSAPFVLGVKPRAASKTVFKCIGYSTHSWEKHSSAVLSGIICDCNSRGSILYNTYYKSLRKTDKREKVECALSLSPMDFPFSISGALMMHFLYFFLVKKEEQASSSGTDPILFSPAFYGASPLL